MGTLSPSKHIENRITTEKQLIDLPVGSIVQESHADSYIKDDSGSWRHTNGQLVDSLLLLAGGDLVMLDLFDIDEANPSKSSQIITEDCLRVASFLDKLSAAQNKKQYSEVAQGAWVYALVLRSVVSRIEAIP